jgi:hypothetical protein
MFASRLRILSGLLLLLCAVTACWAAPPALYVSSAGRNSWSGTLPRANAARTDGPLASPTAARDALRKLREEGKLTGPAVVEVGPGTLFMAEPLILEPQDSEVTFVGAAGARPTISGGRLISGWRQEASGLWVASVPQARDGKWPLRALYVNGQRAILARTPNTGYFRTAGKAPPQTGPDGKEIDNSRTAFRFKPGDIRATPDLTGADAVVFFHWETGMLPLKSVDEASHTVTFTGPLTWPFWSNQRYYVENLREALDAPGEWYLDRAAGLLYYMPRPGEDMRTATVIAPRLQQLVLLRGDPLAGMLVSDVRFENLELAHTNYVLEPTGHSDAQAAVTVNAAIQGTGAKSCSITNCELTHLGNYAVWFERGCTDNTVTTSYIHDGSAGGVRFGEYTIPTGANVTSGNRVSDCLIRDLGIDFYGAIPVWIGHSSGNTVSHNEICDANYSGISCGWSWGYGPSGAHHNIIEYNYLHHLGRGRLCDMAAIYTLGIQPGTVVRNNLIHDIYDWAEGYGAGGIYPDEGSSQMVIENNVAYRTASGGLTVHYGKDNICRNNIFAFGRDNQVYLGRRDKDSSLTLEHNIVYFDEGVLFSRESDLKADNNLYFQTQGEALSFPVGLTFAQWQAKGLDVHSLIADPMFRDPARGDFRLKPGSPALTLGFQPIDTSTCGVTQPAALVKLAHSIQREPSAVPRRSQAPPLKLDEGFEDTPVGSTAELAVTSGDNGLARLRVTDQQAASGKHSLCFEDAPGQTHVFDPHLFYSPNLTAGIGVCSYDLRLEQGAIFWHEWRDSADPYRVGPSLNIDAAGQLIAAKQPLMQIPLGQWVHFEVTCALGKQADGTWTLTVTVPGEAPRKFEKLPCDPKCKQVQWLGFVSNAVERTLFYLDNLKIEAREP